METDAGVMTREQFDKAVKQLMSPEYRMEIMRQKAENELTLMRVLGMLGE